VVSVEWLEPLMLGGTWMPELIEIAGGEALGVTAGGPAPTVTPADLVAMAPDVVVVKPCGFPLERTLAELDAVHRAIPEAVRRTARVYACDGNAFFNRPGPRLVESAEILAACIDPARFADLAQRHAAVICQLA
jgi:iron complex transport system substrate-binding protein